METKQLTIGSVIISCYKGKVIYHLPQSMGGEILQDFKKKNKKQIQNFISDGVYTK